MARMSTKADLKAGLRVCVFSREEAERFDRRVYNVSPDTRLGWKPYTIRVTDSSATALAAFHKASDFKRWLGREARLALHSYGRGVRCGRILPRSALGR